MPKPLTVEGETTVKTKSKAKAPSPKKGTPKKESTASAPDAVTTESTVPDAPKAPREPIHAADNPPKVLKTIKIASIGLDPLTQSVRSVPIMDDMPGSDDLGKLATDIVKRGIQTPLWVRTDPTKANEYLLISGHRRLNAAKKIGMTTVPVIVRDDLTTEDAIYFAAVTENMQRETLDDFDVLTAISNFATKDPDRWIVKSKKKGSDTVSPSILSDELGIPTTKARRYTMILSEFSDLEIAAIQDGIIDQGTEKPITWASIMTAIVSNGSDAARRLAKRVYPELSAPGKTIDKEKQVKKPVKFEALDPKTDLLDADEFRVKLATTPKGGIENTVVDLNLQMPFRVTKAIQEKGLTSKEGRMSFAESMMRMSQAIFNYGTYGLDQADVDTIQAKLDKIGTKTDVVAFNEGLVVELNRVFENLKKSLK